MQIGELAKQTGISVSAVRYYEQVGLLPPAPRTESGYRDYSPETVERVRFILGAKQSGFSLKEIKAVLTLYDQGRLSCEQVARLTRKKIARLERQITQLRQRQAGLQNALRQWEGGNLPDSPFCPILDALNIPDRRCCEMARTIEVFTAGCTLCDETLQYVREAVTTCGCTVIERTPDSPEAQQYGISAVPAIVVEGQLLFVGKPTREQAVALLRQ